MAAQVKDFNRRLHTSAAVGNKALEYWRLSEVKCSGSVSLPCLAAICIELAASQLKEPLDKKQVQKLSGVPTKAYLRCYQTVEKLLNLDFHLGVRDLAVMFGCLEAVNLAEEILDDYGEGIKVKYSAVQREGMDLRKPLYTATALYCSCKLLKIRCNKTKFQTWSKSTGTLFQNVLDEMMKCARDKPLDEQDKGRKKRKLMEEDSAKKGDQSAIEPAHSTAAKRETLHSRILSDPTSREYLQWKEKTLRQARAELEAV